MTAKNYHLVQDCLVEAKRACLLASGQRRTFDGVASHKKVDCASTSPLSHATHTYILGVRVGMFKRESP